MFFSNMAGKGDSLSGDGNLVPSGGQRVRVSAHVHLSLLLPGGLRRRSPLLLLAAAVGAIGAVDLHLSVANASAVAALPG